MGHLPTVWKTFRDRAWKGDVVFVGLPKGKDGRDTKRQKTESRDLENVFRLRQTVRRLAGTDRLHVRLLS